MNDIFYSRVRLAIVAELLDSERVPFTDLQRTTNTTKGNLGAHLAKLIDAGYVVEKKLSGMGRRQTVYLLTASGRAAFLAHIRVLEDLLHAARREHSEPNPLPLRPPALQRRA